MFTGEGYDKRFVLQMHDVIAKLDDPESSVHLSIGCDEICKACPHLKNGVCDFNASVMRKDRATLEYLGLVEGEIRSSSLLRSLVEDRLSVLKDIDEVCGECEWSELCNQRLKGILNRVGGSR
jgi:hypothetical protein